MQVITNSSTQFGHNILQNIIHKYYINISENKVLKERLDQQDQQKRDLTTLMKKGELANLLSVIFVGT